MLITSALPNCYPAGEDADVGKTFIKNQPDKSKIILKKKRSGSSKISENEQIDYNRQRAKGVSQKHKTDCKIRIWIQVNTA